MDNLEASSNPQPPLTDDAIRKQAQMSNSDFRKLLLTSSSGKSHKDAANSNSLRSRSERTKLHSHKSHHKSRPHHHQDRKKKNVEEGGAVNIADALEAGSGNAAKYRDRARERREGKIASNMDGLDPSVIEGAAEDVEGQEDEHNRLIRTADYRAVAPTVNSTHAAERRRAIEESKYFGGDMEHTHLVKGLDYILLEKVRREIENKELEAEQQLDVELDKSIGDGKRESTVGRDGGIQFKTSIAEAIFETLFKTRQGKIERNEFFQPGRMAYRVELEDEMAEFEVPATVIRSKADCSLSDQATIGSSDLTTNDIVINKLAQIFAYTRAGRRQAKRAKAAKQKTGGNASEYGIQPADGTKVKSQPIFEDAPTDYVPSRRSRKGDAEDERRKGGHRRGGGAEATRQAKATADPSPPPQSSSRYFDKPLNSDDLNTSKNSLSATKDFIQQLATKYSGTSKGNEEQAHLERLLKKTEISGYDECYPGFAESYDAMGDSDDETDFSKMDMGNKKGPIGRWDFETQEEYGDYMSSLEAMPKAAYQYGVKKPEGRKTRRIGTQKNERAQVDRQLQQITSMINKRKQLAEEVGDGSSGKRMKY